MERYDFSSRSIDEASERLECFFLSSGADKREVLRARLTFEEILLSYRAAFGEGAAFTVRAAKRFSSARVELVVEGDALDPFNGNSEEDNLLHNLLAGLGLAPSWSYKKNKNYVVFTLKKKPLSGTVKMGIAILLALAAGFLLTGIPERVSVGLNEYLLTPVSDGIMGLIGAVAAPLIFFSVLGSICSMGSMETLGRIGSKTVKVILVYITLIGIVMTAVGCLFFPVEWEGSADSNFSQVANLVYDIVPSNLFEPFLTGNALQLIFISVLVGLAMLALSSRVSGVRNIVEQLNSIVQTIMSGLTALLPLLIFTLFTGMISSGKIRAILDSWKMVVMFCGMVVSFYILNLLRIALTKRVSPFLLFKKAFPTWLIAFTTSSSAAALTTAVDDAHKRLGIDKKLADFGIPIGQVLFMPGLISLFFSMEANFAVIYGIPITLQWILVGFVTNILISFAMPPIPGGAMMGFTIVFAQLGIPMKVLGIALAVNVVTDFLGTSVNFSSWQLTLIDVADSLGMLDRETLRNKSNESSKDSCSNAQPGGKREYGSL